MTKCLRLPWGSALESVIIMCKDSHVIIDQEGLKTFPVKNCAVVREDNGPSEKEIKEKLKTTKRELVMSRRRFFLTLLIALILAAAIVAMMVISSKGETVTVLNYRNKIINEYEDWEQELVEREKTIEEYEQKYNIGNTQNDQ